MKKLIATLVAGTLLASSLPALAGPFDGRRSHDDRHARVERHEYYRHNVHSRRNHYSPGLGVLGAGLLLGGIVLASERPRPAPLLVAPVSVPVMSAPPQPLWYYCETARAYYPYVNACPGGWRAVPATAY